MIGLGDDDDDDDAVDNDVNLNDEEEPTSKLDNFLTVLLTLEKDCPFRNKVTHSRPR